MIDLVNAKAPLPIIADFAEESGQTEVSFMLRILHVEWWQGRWILQYGTPAKDWRGVVTEANGKTWIMCKTEQEAEERLWGEVKRLIGTLEKQNGR